MYRLNFWIQLRFLGIFSLEELALIFLVSTFHSNAKEKQTHNSLVPKPKTKQKNSTNKNRTLGDQREPKVTLDIHISSLYLTWASIRET